MGASLKIPKNVRKWSAQRTKGSKGRGRLGRNLILVTQPVWHLTSTHMAVTCLFAKSQNIEKQNEPDFHGLKNYLNRPLMGWKKRLCDVFFRAAEGIQIDNWANSWNSQNVHLRFIINLHTKFQPLRSSCRGIMRRTNSKNEKKKRPKNYIFGAMRECNGNEKSKPLKYTSMSPTNGTRKIPTS